MGQGQFWIVGGEYADMQFGEILEGTERVIGPFSDRTDAERAWRRVSEENRSRCLVRFTIAVERLGPAAGGHDAR